MKIIVFKRIYTTKLIILQFMLNFRQSIAPPRAKTPESSDNMYTQAFNANPLVKLQSFQSLLLANFLNLWEISFRHLTIWRHL